MVHTSLTHLASRFPDHHGVLRWSVLEVWAATISTHQFGRYEILRPGGEAGRHRGDSRQVRRQTGLPEYPLVLGNAKTSAGAQHPRPRKPSHPARLHGVPMASGTGAATARFIVERSVRQGETLTLSVRHVNAPGQVSLAVDLRNLEHMLEGQR